MRSMVQSQQQQEVQNRPRKFELQKAKHTISLSIKAPSPLVITAEMIAGAVLLNFSHKILTIKVAATCPILLKQIKKQVPPTARMI